MPIFVLFQNTPSRARWTGTIKCANSRTASESKITSLRARTARFNRAIAFAVPWRDVFGGGTRTCHLFVTLSHPAPPQPQDGRGGPALTATAVYRTPGSDTATAVPRSRENKRTSIIPQRNSVEGYRRGRFRAVRARAQTRTRSVRVRNIDECLRRNDPQSNRVRGRLWTRRRYEFDNVPRLSTPRDGFHSGTSSPAITHGRSFAQNAPTTRKYTVSCRSGTCNTNERRSNIINRINNCKIVCNFICNFYTCPCIAMFVFLFCERSVTDF